MEFDYEYIPAPDHVAAMHGYSAAIVWGAIWRHCQVKGYCDIPLKNLAKECGMSRRTIMRHIRILRDSGFIIDRTPDRRNAPHELIVNADDLEKRDWDV